MIQDLKFQWCRAFGRCAHILTFGCTYNEGESNLIHEILLKYGCLITTDPDSADLVILNTCIVIGKTERKMLKTIEKFIGKEIWVTGCLPLARGDLLNAYPDITVIYSDAIHAEYDKTLTITPAAVGIVQIGSGCLGSCKYCITRSARGRIQSIQAEKILSRIQTLSDRMAVEIRLCGQDLSSYGGDRGQLDLPKLLRGVGRLNGRFRVRLGMMNPATLLPILSEVIDAIKSDRIFRFLHLPVQSGSDQVLYAMGRGYGSKEILDIVSMAKEKIPDLTLATDFIAGYPGETESDHNASLSLLELMQPDKVNVTRYSWRPGINMSREDELPDRVRKDRSREIIQKAYLIQKDRKERLIGQTTKAVVTEMVRAGSVMARTESYQGVVIADEIPLGRDVTVRITECNPHYLKGVLVRS